jgi:uncharacterized protein (DUF983 family)
MATASRFLAILRQQCPCCYQGRVFRGSMTMNETCPSCGVHFQREEGYFLGAMYISYGLSSIILLVAYIAVGWLFPDWSDLWVLTLSVAILLPFVPLVFRYSRVVWMHFDRWAWPRG